LPRDWEAYYRVMAGPDHPAFVVRAYAGLIPPGYVLDLAGGAGRNAFFLAARGHNVLVLEKSREALLRLAARGARGVRGVWFDLESDEPLPPGPFSAVVMSYFVERRLLSRAAEVLAPGGLFLIEGFGRPEAVRRGRPNSPHYWEPGELLRPPVGLEVLAYGEGVRELAYRVYAVWRRL